MQGKVSIKQKRREAPAWVFAWKPLGRPWQARVFPVLLTGGLFALGFVVLSVQVTPLKPWNARKGVLIQAIGNEDGRALALRAREGGPFPSRFDLRGWSRKAGLDEALLNGVLSAPAPYVPKLGQLPPEDSSADSGLIDAGIPVLPAIKPDAPPSVPAGGGCELMPVIRALSGIRAADLPVNLPAFAPASDSKWAAGNWRFVVRLDASGNVLEAVALSGEDDSALADWLMGVVFPSKNTKAPRWVGVEVGFINRKTDGTGNH